MNRITVTLSVSTHRFDHAMEQARLQLLTYFLLGMEPGALVTSWVDLDG